MNNYFPAQPESNNVTETAFPCFLFILFLVSSCSLESRFKKAVEQRKVTKTTEVAVPAVPKREAAE